MIWIDRLLLACLLCSVASGTLAQDRIVVIGASYVEIAYALGLGDRIVGVDQTATHPPETAEVASIGYFRQVPAEGVLALSPDLVIATPDAGPPEALELISRTGVPVRIAPEVEAPEFVPEKYAFMGHVLGLEAEAAALSEDYLSRLDQASAGAMAPRKALFVMTIEGGNPLVAGQNTAPDTVFSAAGLVNAASHLDGYRAVGPEALIALAPEAVIMMPSHAARAGGLDAVMELPGFAQSPAKRSGRYRAIDGALFMRFGPRTPGAIAELRALFEP